MKPNSSQTISRLVCTMRAMLNGMYGNSEVADHVLQAQREAEDDLADEQAHGGDEVELGDRLRLVFEVWILSWCFSFNLRCSAAILGVDLAGPLQELHQVVQLLLVQVELRHLAAARPPVGMAFIQALMKSPPRRL